LGAVSAINTVVPGFTGIYAGGIVGSGGIVEKCIALNKSVAGSYNSAHRIGVTTTTTGFNFAAVGGTWAGSLPVTTDGYTYIGEPGTTISAEDFQGQANQEMYTTLYPDPSTGGGLGEGLGWAFTSVTGSETTGNGDWKWFYPTLVNEQYPYPVLLWQTVAPVIPSDPQ
jgi:hypothetical protein